MEISAIKQRPNLHHNKRGGTFKVRSHPAKLLRSKRNFLLPQSSHQIKAGANVVQGVQNSTQAKLGSVAHVMLVPGS